MILALRHETWSVSTHLCSGRSEDGEECQAFLPEAAKFFPMERGQGVQLGLPYFGKGQPLAPAIRPADHRSLEQKRWGCSRTGTRNRAEALPPPDGGARPGWAPLAASAGRRSRGRRRSRPRSGCTHRVGREATTGSRPYVRRPRSRASRVAPASSGRSFPRPHSSSCNGVGSRHRRSAGTAPSWPARSEDAIDPGARWTQRRSYPVIRLRSG
jgi:hypothetical protein